MVWLVGGGVTAVIALGTAALLIYRPAHLKERVERAISTHLNLDTTIGELSFGVFPRPRISADDVVLRVPGHPDWPAFITIAHVWADVGLLSGMRQHVGTVHADGLRIVVPHGSGKDEIVSDAGKRSASASKIIIDHFVTHDAELTFAARDVKHRPLVFSIQSLEVDAVGFDRQMPFVATMTNPEPTGTIRTRGAFGPWVKGNLGATPVAGRYTFSDANLDTINGIGGTLSSEGEYTGRLTEIAVSGTTDTPDFNLDLGGAPVPLKTVFKAVVDATDGTVHLQQVDAVLLHSAMRVKGDIVNLPGPGRHDIKLSATIPAGHIEDLLALAINSPKPPITGPVALQLTLLLPPGPSPVAQRLATTGRFSLNAARFTSPDVQGKMRELSRRSQGKGADEVPESIASRVSGAFDLKAGVLHLRDVAFSVPGAGVALSGTYTLKGGSLDFAGTLTMDATISRAVGGVKSIFLKPFDFWFKKNGAGAVLPIHIGGTWEHPALGVNVSKALHRSNKP